MKNGDMVRFEDKYIPVTESGCWLWDATPGSVYGLFWLNGKNEHAHRASWILHNGPIPKGAWVLHHCDVKGCVNPDHLYLGDRAQNTRDAVKRGRMQSGSAHHRAGTRTANQGNGHINDDFCRTVKRLSQSLPVKSIAAMKGTHISTIYRGIKRADALLKALEDTK